MFRHFVVDSPVLRPGRRKTKMLGVRGSKGGTANGEVEDERGISRVSRDLIEVEMALFRASIDNDNSATSPSMLPSLKKRRFSDAAKLGAGIAEEFLRFESLLYSGYMNGYIEKRDIGPRYMRNMNQLNEWLENKWVIFKRQEGDAVSDMAKSTAKTEAEFLEWAKKVAESVMTESETRLAEVYSDDEDVKTPRPNQADVEAAAAAREAAITRWESHVSEKERKRQRPPELPEPQPPKRRSRTVAVPPSPPSKAKKRPRSAGPPSNAAARAAGRGRAKASDRGGGVSSTSSASSTSGPTPPHRPKKTKPPPPTPGKGARPAKGAKEPSKKPAFK